MEVVSWVLEGYFGNSINDPESLFHCCLPYQRSNWHHFNRLPPLPSTLLSSIQVIQPLLPSPSPFLPASHFLSDTSLSPTILTMRFQNLPIRSMLFFLLVLLLVGQLPTFSHGGRIMERKWRGESSPSMGYYSNIASSQENGKDEVDPVHGASKRLVPQGPNPLHN